MYSEDDLLPISALQHLMFCERQCALIHIEQVWEENRFTAEGRIMHEKCHEEGHESRGNIRIERGLALRSFKLRLIGKADVVEFHKANNTWLPFPVEYKRGKPKLDDCDKVQLCAQAICLEEMLGVCIPKGAIFYGKTLHRLEVNFDETLRNETENLTIRLHEFIKQAITPQAEYDERCGRCSLLNLCMPRRTGQGSVKKYMESIGEE
ncbi:MAG: CRISPR-associated protein Cas4 [Candidatus Aureabacteria bacterium]|nr:CRISPR-associated protein Cas4 [Candidatus Auribacterota bacterium]